MIFSVLNQDCPDENEARRRLHLAAVRHSGCKTRTKDFSQTGSHSWNR